MTVNFQSIQLLLHNYKTPNYTSIQQRLRAYQEKAADNQMTSRPQASAIKTNRETSEHILLNAFVDGCNKQKRVPSDEIDYFEMTDWTGRAVHPTKKGAIPQGQPMFLKRLDMPKESWIETVVSYERHFSDYVGQETSMKRAGALRGVKWLRELRACQRLFSTSHGGASATEA